MKKEGFGISYNLGTATPGLPPNLVEYTVVIHAANLIWTREATGTRLTGSECGQCDSDIHRTDVTEVT